MTSVGIGFTTGSAGVETGAFAGSVEACGAAGDAAGGFTGLFTGVTFFTGAGVG